jgi:hypothetical protein
LSPVSSERRAASQRRFYYGGLTVVGLSAAAVAGLAQSPLRSVLVALAVLVVPGAAIMGFVRLKDVLTELLLTVVVSLSLAVIGTQVMIWLGIWHPTALLIVTCLLSVAVLLRHMSVVRAGSRVG